MKNSFAIYGAILLSTTVMAADQQLLSKEDVMTMFANEFSTIDPSISEHMYKTFGGDMEKMWEVAKKLTSDAQQNNEPESEKNLLEAAAAPQEQLEQSKQEQLVSLLKESLNNNEETFDSILTKIQESIRVMNADDLKWTDGEGQTLFHLAASIKTKTNESNQSIADYTVFYLRAHTTQLGCADLINQSSNNGLTPLHLAAFSGNVRLLKELTSNLTVGTPANVTAETPQGISVLDAAFNHLEGCLEENDQEKLNIARMCIGTILALIQEQGGASSNTPGTPESGSLSMTYKSSLLLRAIDKCGTINENTKQYLHQLAVTMRQREEAAYQRQLREEALYHQKKREEEQKAEEERQQRLRQQTQRRRYNYS